METRQSSLINRAVILKSFVSYFSNEHKKKFRLSDRFVEKYHKIPPPFGYNGLGEIVYRRTYSRAKPDGSNESWAETVERVVNGTYNMQKDWIDANQLPWNAWKAQKSAQEMYDRMFQMKFLPPGRGLWAMGSAITEERKIYAALNNCAFVSTEKLAEDPSKPFVFLMDAAMLGVGVGFDTKGAGSVVIQGIDTLKPKEKFTIPDSREGWVEALRMVLEASFKGKSDIVFDYSQIRPPGTPIRGFGGIASGPKALEHMLNDLKELLNHHDHVGKPITSTIIVDIMNMIGRCVVSGNVRRAAEIAFGEPNDIPYLDLKNYKVNPHRSAYGWTSNNSVYAQLGMNYTQICDRIRINGEPGLAWLDNMRNYGRMNGIIDDRDWRAGGGNPCLEQTLESFELCCLVETFPAKHTSLQDFKRTLKYAYLYAKTVTLGKTHWPETNRVMLRNRRIGCSVSGLAQFLSKQDTGTLKSWLEEGYKAIQHWDQVYSEWMTIPRSIKTTSVKPSGTVSLLAGATPGMHFPESRFYIRRVRLSKDSPLLNQLKAAEFPTEPAVDQPDTTVVVEIPVDVGEGVRTLKDVSMWEQLSFAAFLQKYWADNQVSCTITFDPKSEGAQLEHALQYFQYQLKGISFLPALEHGAYPQMPYESISEKEYQKRVAQLKTLNIEKTGGEVPVPDRFCDADVCGVLPPTAT